MKLLKIIALTVALLLAVCLFSSCSVQGDGGENPFEIAGDKQGEGSGDQGNGANGENNNDDNNTANGGNSGSNGANGDNQSGQESPNAEEDPPVTPGENLQGYQKLYPEMYSNGKFEYEKTDDKVFYLTIDDGPSGYTSEILDILKEKDAKATFFIVASKVRGHEAEIKRMIAEGHGVGIHCNEHEYKKIYKSVEAFLLDFNTAYTTLYEITGAKPSVFRFPGGSVNSYNKAVFKDIIAEMQRRGFTYYDWNVSAGDSSSEATVETSTGNIVSNFKDYKKPQVLMHELAPSVSALPAIIDAARKSGYRLDIITNKVKPVHLPYK